jgi:PAS domain S-box-containing protein
VGSVLAQRDQRARADVLDVTGQIIDALPSAVYVCDRDGLITSFNRRAAELWGRAPRIGDAAERFCGSYRLYRLDGGPLAHAECPMAEVLRTGAPLRGQELIVERPDGTRAVALVNLETLRNDAGELVGAINCVEDITQRRTAEQALQNERRYRQLLGLLPAAVYMTDAAGRITYYNEAAAELWGCRPELGKSEFCGSWKLYWPDGTPLPHDECPMAIALKEKRPIRGKEAVAERPDGTRVPFLPYPTPLFDPSGGIIGAVNMLVDISHRKSAEQVQAALYEFTNALYRAETPDQVYEAALDAIGRALGCTRSSILLLDEAGVMRFVAWRSLSAPYRAAVEGHSPWTPADRDPQPVCIKDVDVSDLDPSLKAVVKAEEIAALAFIPLLAQGSLIGKFMAYLATPHAFTNSELDAGITIARQLAFAVQRMRAEEARRRAQEDLERFNRAAVNRELRIIEMKKEVNELCARLGEAGRYPLTFAGEQRHVTGEQGLLPASERREKSA